MRALIHAAVFAALALAAPQSGLTGGPYWHRNPDWVPHMKATDAAPSAATSDSPAGSLVNTTVVSSANITLANATRAGCVPEPERPGPKIEPDTPEAFLDSKILSLAAQTAGIPDGFSVSFRDDKESMTGDGYLGVRFVDRYEPDICAELCHLIPGCLAFNLFYERDPAFTPGVNCTNPPSTTAIKCTFWDRRISDLAPRHAGSFMGPKDEHGDAFQVVIAGSIGFSAVALPDTCPGFMAAAQFKGALTAPILDSIDTHIGQLFLKENYRPCVCADYCRAQTERSKTDPDGDGKITPCNFFTSYVLLEDEIPVGMFCDFYTRAWPEKFASRTSLAYKGRSYLISQALAYTAETQEAQALPPKPDAS